MADTEKLADQLGSCAESQDFAGAFSLVRENQVELAKGMAPAEIRDALKKTTRDRLLLSFIDGADFGARPLAESLVRLEKLVYLVSKKPGEAGALVLSKAWGLGKVRSVDDFYRRVTVDFRTKRGHQFTYASACDMLEPAPDGHILVKRESDPAGFETLLKDKPGDFVVEVLKSFGDMPVVRLEDVCVQNGFVKPAAWKAFWDSARAALRHNKNVEVPARRADPIRIKASVEDYGEGWLTAFAHETDPKRILAMVREFVAQGKLKGADEATRAKIGERLVFAVTAARKVDDALYARLAGEVVALGFQEPPASEMREYLWDRRRYIKAAAELPAREVGAMVSFLASDAEAKDKLLKSIPDLCFTAVSEIVAQFGGDPACRAAVGEMMRQPKAPPTLTTLLVGRYEQFLEWKELPPLITLLAHAVALGEGRQSGETLKMQNLVRRLFADKTWLEKVFGWLSPEDQALFFERFQASIAWDPSTHHATVVRMTKIAPALESHVVKAETKREYARVTSYRSYGLRKAEYLKLINEDMPANVKRIEFAKSYGDLSENAEYQYAKDEQRALMQKQTLMQAELEAVKPGDFSDATTDEVMPGVTVVIAANGEEKAWTVLGEWDNDLPMGIISSKTRVAQNMLGKKVGDSFELPDAEGGVSFAEIREIRPLGDDVREWMKLPPGVEI
ncbi:MAG: GreA/GreB family elongation factor [Kiritimatiellae bacterium]|nr:GreA/GreB family elongation factor [Kiritimatiellia bacterium]MBQ6331099.1 GreA/GreB family elongation factor [Kiritimatiellia bacterium]